MSGSERSITKLHWFGASFAVLSVMPSLLLPTLSSGLLMVCWALTLAALVVTIFGACLVEPRSPRINWLVASIIILVAVLSVLLSFWRAFSPEGNEFSGLH